MADTATPLAATSPATSKAAAKKGTTAPKKPKVKKPAPNHPKVSEMVVAAVTTLKERGGSSLQAIKKYLATNYTVDIEKLAPFIKRYLKTAVADGTLVQTKSSGASGSFKLGAKSAKKEKTPKVAIKPAAEKKGVAKPKKTTAAAAKKTAKPTKKAAKSPKKPKTPKKATSPKKAKASKKEKKAKTPKKTKSPKPKKAAKKTAKK